MAVVPSDVPAIATASFFLKYLQPGANIIEVGCGTGEVAHILGVHGVNVIAVDSDPKCVAEARQNGVNAVEARWEHYEGAVVDAVIFTRSLHHMHSLAEAIAKSRDLLKKAGLLIVEDFAYEETEPAAINWFCVKAKYLEEQQAIDLSKCRFILDLVESAQPSQVWLRHHTKELHTAKSIVHAIENEFNLVALQNVPYMYRYLIPLLKNKVKAAKIAESLLSEEFRLGKTGKFKPIGRRIVAVKR